MKRVRTHGLNHQFGAETVLAVSFLFQLGCDRVATEGATSSKASQEKLASPAAAASPAALGLAAAKLGVSTASVILGVSQTLVLPLTGKGPITRQKAHALFAGKIVSTSIAVDSNGNAVDADSLLASEEAVRRAKFGKKTEDLYNRLQSSKQGQNHQVSFWLHIPDADTPLQTTSRVGYGSPGSMKLNAQSVESLRNAAHMAYAKSTANVKTRFRTALGKLDSTAVDPGDQPYFIATLSIDAIAALEANVDVDTIDLADRQPTLQLDNAKGLLDYNRIHAAPISLTGAGVNVAQIENSAPAPSASPITPFSEPNPGTGCGDDANHMERVASVIRSLDSFYAGVAPNANLYLGGKCSSTTSDLETQANNGKNWGAVAMNNSWGFPTTTTGARPSNDDKFFDSLVFNNRLTVVHSAGNSTDQMPDCRAKGGTGIATTGMVISPGLGFNVITVGGADREISSQYSGVWPCSAWKNPGSTNGDRNKPEVIAPAVLLDTLTTCGQESYFDPNTCDMYGEVDGTSLSAPFVTGAAALLLQSAPILGSWPEIVKAVLMAASQPMTTSDTDHYGAGLVNIGAAADTIRGVNGNWGGDNPPQCSGTWPYTQQMYLLAGSQTRFAIVWSQDPNYSQYANQPQADLDLWALDPQGNQFQSQVGNSWDNNYEFIDFVPPQTGTYTLMVTNYRCDSTVSRIGFAWHQAS
jgi:hypothetical protein